MALSGKQRKYTTVLVNGAPRSIILAELGDPNSTIKNNNDELVDTWIITKGNEPDALRALLHGALDVSTFGLWEIVGTPLEMIAAHEDHYAYVVTYDNKECLKGMKVERLKSSPKTGKEE